MEVQGCSEGCDFVCSRCEWEVCRIVADHGDLCDVRIIDDGELCTGVQRRHVRPMARAVQKARSDAAETLLAATAPEPLDIDTSALSAALEAGTGPLARIPDVAGSLRSVRIPPASQRYTSPPVLQAYQDSAVCG